MYKVTNQLIAPILELSETLEYISKTQSLSTQLEYDSKNEIGKLYGSFNILLTSIRTHQEELYKFTQELERRVEERTEELLDSLESLKKAQKQLVESEKWHHLEHL
ncbi:MAG: HAMP domain-containing protein [Sulfurimonas sp.]|nr:HAMP domain-containing protein [Sulfurimonas sp.]